MKAFSLTLMAISVTACGFALAALNDEPKLYEVFAPPKPADGITWRVSNNFRIISSQKEQDQYYTDLRVYYPDAIKNCWGDSLGTHINCAIRGAFHRHLTPVAAMNYSTHWQTRYAQFEPGWAIDTKRSIELRYAQGGLNPAACHWSFDNVTLRSTSCRNAPVATTLGKHHVTVETISTEGAPIALENDIELRDVLIVALGDSYGAGEGSSIVQRTNRSPALWMDKRCHNSLFAGFSIAAARIALDNPQQSVTFLTYACSGAEIDGDTADYRGGILTPYWGRETAYQVKKDYHGKVPEEIIPLEGPLPPQLTRAKEALCPPGDFDRINGTCATAFRSPDFVFVSTGGNEMEFGPIVEKLATTIRGCEAKCRKENIEADLASHADALPMRYDALGIALTALSPKSVLLTEYPDPTKNEAGRFCADHFFALRPVFLPRVIEGIPFVDLGLRGDDTKYAYDLLFTVLPDLMQRAAARNNWKYVTGIHKASQNKGYCSRRRWYNDYSTSRDSQGDIAPQKIGEGEPSAFVAKDGTRRAILSTTVSTGAMHPNMFGYSMMGDAVYSAVKEAQH